MSSHEYNLRPRHCVGEEIENGHPLRKRKRQTDRSIDGFPVEIISRIFEYLSLDDRKIARLTCKQWNECAMGRLFWGKGKCIVIRLDSDTATIADTLTLMKSNFTVMNLEFQSTNTDPIPARVWKTLGDRVRSLHFQLNLQPYARALELAILNCQCLESIKIVSGSGNGELLRVLNYFVKKNIVCTRIRSFEFYSGKHIDVDLLKKVVSVFPHIKNFGSSFSNCQQGVSECLELLMPINHDVSEEPILTGLRFRLTKVKIQTYGPHTDALKNSLHNFFTVQEDLQTISLEFVSSTGASGAFHKQLIFHILRNCPDLREFNYLCHLFPLDIPEWTSEEVREFLDRVKNLKCLQIDCLDWSGQVLPPSISSTNLMLTVLCLCGYPVVNVESLAYLLKYCPKLKEVRLQGFCCDKLCKLFEHQFDLDTLTFCDLFGQCNIGNSTCQGTNYEDKINQFLETLQKLECLELAFYHSASAQFVRKFIEKMQITRFPQMKHLRLTCKCFGRSALIPQTNNEKLQKLLQNTPALKSLELPELQLEKFDGRFELFRGLPKLYYLDVAKIENPKILGPLFRICPDLKYITDGQKMYWLNSSNEEVEIASRHYLTFHNRKRSILPSF